MACEHGHIDVVKLLIEAGADINQARTDNGAPPLFMTCQKGHIDTARLLIEAGADINQATTDDACTPLIIAACERTCGNIVNACLFLAHYFTQMHCIITSHVIIRNSPTIRRSKALFIFFKIRKF